MTKSRIQFLSKKENKYQILQENHFKKDLSDKNGWRLGDTQYIRIEIYVTDRDNKK